MWRAWQSLNSWRRLVAMMASSPTRVSSSWLVDAGELMDGLEFPDILQQWKMQRGSWQKAAWVWRCSMGFRFLGFRCLTFLRRAGCSGVLGFHVGGGRFQKRAGE